MVPHDSDYMHKLCIVLRFVVMRQANMRRVTIIVRVPWKAIRRLGGVVHTNGSGRFRVCRDCRLLRVGRGFRCSCNRYQW